MKNTKDCKPVWIMDELLTARQLFSLYGIQQRDLPKGSRALHNCFESEINSHYAQLQQLMPVTNWNKIPMLVGAQKSIKREEAHKKKKTFINLECLNHTDLNQAIRHSVEQIKREELELIPILNINGRVYCDALIPIRVGSKWFAVQYKTATVSPYRATVTGLCVDAEDILNKASLVDPNAVTTYKWILGAKPGLALEDVASDESIRTDASMMSDLANQNTFGLAQQLQDALQREKMLTVMLMNQTKLKTSQSVRFMSLANNNANSVPPSPSVGPSTVPMIQTPSILSMASSQSAPMLPMMTPNAMMTPPPFNLSGSFIFNPSVPSSAASSPSFGAQQMTMQNMIDDFALH